MDCITAENLRFSYTGTEAGLDIPSLAIAEGSFTALLGRNGCGKSTLARHFNGLLTPDEGTMRVCGMDTADPDALPEIRRRCGMVFQNPENQFVSPIVEEDIRFGLRNFGFPESEWAERTASALAMVEMSGFERRNPQLLSGGQKARIALAGVLAVEPAILVFDEATAMLDPGGRRTVLRLMTKLCREEGRTVIMITQRPEEAAAVDRVLLMDGGKIIADESPAVIFSDTELIRNAGLRPPFTAKLWNEIRDLVPDPGTDCPLDIRQLTERLCR